jgi:phosphopantetheinyl transferase
METLVPLLAARERRRLTAMRDRPRALARAHAYVLLRSLLSLTADGAPLEYDPSGAPRFHTHSVHVSISHTRSRVFVAACDEQPIGADLADLRGEIDAAGFLRYVAHDEERSVIDRMTASGWTLRSAVTTVWSIKEAVFKCAGTDFVPLAAVVRSLADGSATVQLASTSYRCTYEVCGVHVQTIAVEA